MLKHSLFFPKIGFSVVVALCVSGITFADVRMPAVFSDHMVLQQNTRVPVWGWADPGEKICVSIAGKTKTAKAGKDGKWSVRLGKMSSGSTLVLTVQGKNTLIINDVLVGEVWLASGQSNMAMQVSRCDNFDQEKTRADFPQLRMFTVMRLASLNPQSDCKGQWVVCTPDTVGNFSATAYFYAREIHQHLNVPVGILHSSWGGTKIEQWTSIKAMQRESKLRNFVEAYQLQTMKRARQNIKKPAKIPSNLYCGMISPLIPYAIRGAIWYQGEANSATPESAALYATQLPVLIKDWRSRWDQGAFPFAWVQLPNYSRKGEGWTLVRESMLQTLSVRNTGMAVTIDIGVPGDIHPKNKQDVGKRLSLWALGDVYGKKVASSSGPLLTGHKIKGRKIVLSFNHADGGLIAKDGELKGFELAGPDGQWRAAQARIEGNKILVSSPEIKKPSAARYAWSNTPICSLYNGAGLPASPFRTRSPNGW